MNYLNFLFIFLKNVEQHIMQKQEIFTFSLVLTSIKHIKPIEDLQK